MRPVHLRVQHYNTICITNMLSGDISTFLITLCHGHVSLFFWCSKIYNPSFDTWWENVLTSQYWLGITIYPGYWQYILSSTPPSTLRFHVECKTISWEWAWPPFLFACIVLCTCIETETQLLGIKECLDETLWNPNMYNCHSIPGRIDNSAQFYDIQSMNSNIELNFPHRFL